MDFVAAPVVRHGQEIGVAEARLHVLHGRHRTIACLRNPCRHRVGARTAMPSMREGGRAASYANGKMSVGDKGEGPGAEPTARCLPRLPPAHDDSRRSSSAWTFDLQADRIDDPVLGNAVPREQVHLAASGRWKPWRVESNLYGDVGRRARHRVRLHPGVCRSARKKTTSGCTTSCSSSTRSSGAANAMPPDSAPVRAQQHDELRDRAI